MEAAESNCLACFTARKLLIIGMPQRKTNQITFVGKEYGGAQERFGDIRMEAAFIVADIRPILEQWSEAVAEAKLLVEAIPSQAKLEYLFSPF